MPDPAPSEDRPPLSRAVDWCFRDRETGRLTIAQTPNVPLAVFIGAWLLRRLLAPTGGVDVVLNIVATAALAIWASDEVARGVNPWRRALGAVVLVALVAGFFRR